MGNSGTTLRIAMGSAALVPLGHATTLTGDEQIQSRPIGPLMHSLGELGANCRSLRNNGKAPIEISGKLIGGRTSIAASTSQYLSSLLLCTPLAADDTDIDVPLLNEPGYVRMTLDWLDKQQIRYDNRRMREFAVKGGQSYTPFDAAVPADFSSATLSLTLYVLLTTGAHACARAKNVVDKTLEID